MWNVNLLFLLHRRASMGSPVSHQHWHMTTTSGYWLSPPRQLPSPCILCIVLLILLLLFILFLTSLMTLTSLKAWCGTKSGHVTLTHLSVNCFLGCVSSWSRSTGSFNARVTKTRGKKTLSQICKNNGEGGHITQLTIPAILLLSLLLLKGQQCKSRMFWHPISSNTTGTQYQLLERKKWKRKK